jgi:CRISP-associated protein Cas1
VTAGAGLCVVSALHRRANSCCSPVGTRYISIVTDGVGTNFYRFRVVIAPDAPLDLHPHQAGLVYAVLAAAYGHSSGTEDVLPDGLMLDAPEQCRVRVDAGAPFAFGFTLLRDTPQDALATMRALVDGLEYLSRNRHRKHAVLGANFRIESVEDLVARAAFDTSRFPTSIPRALIEAEAERAAGLETLTLRFSSPLRMTKPKGDRTRAVEYYDRDYFNAGVFCLRAVRRLHELGLVAAAAPLDGEAASVVLASSPDDRSILSAAQLVENRLVWMNFAYGPRSDGSSCFGAVGRVRLRVLRRDVRRVLAWAQYARLGQATKFGQGAFRIEELGAPLFPCERSTGLAELCLRHLDIDEAAERYQLPAGTLRRAAKQVLQGRFAPRDVHRVPIVQPDGRERTLAIPTPVERGLQRAIHAGLAPGLDRFFEECSVAYRRGLSRLTAARRVRDALRFGYRFGLRADFRRFFDSIPHDILRDRLEAYLADDQLVALLMRWFEADAPVPGYGIPTAAPISPLIANLFLDRFDE